MKKQCTKCNKWIWVNTTTFNGKIPQHTCIDDPIMSEDDDIGSTFTQIAIVETVSELIDDSSSYSSIDTSSSDIGGGGDFGGAGSSSDF